MAESTRLSRALVLRLAIAFVAMCISIAGHIDEVGYIDEVTGGVIQRQFDTTFYVWLSVDLLAPAILALGIRRLKTALACGAVLILLNTIPWVFWLLGSIDALHYVIFGHLFVITTCLIGAIVDQGNAHKARQTT